MYILVLLNPGLNPSNEMLDRLLNWSINRSSLYHCTVPEYQRSLTVCKHVGILAYGCDYINDSIRIYTLHLLY